MKELEGQRRWEKYPIKGRKLGWNGVGMYWEEKTNMWAREWWWCRCRGIEGEEHQIGGGWIASGTTCWRENCQGRKRKWESMAERKKRRDRHPNTPQPPPDPAVDSEWRQRTCPDRQDAGWQRIGDTRWKPGRRLNTHSDSSGLSLRPGWMEETRLAITVTINVLTVHHYPRSQRGVRWSGISVCLSICLSGGITQKVSLRFTWFFYTRSSISVARSSSKKICIETRIWTQEFI